MLAALRKASAAKAQPEPVSTSNGKDQKPKSNGQAPAGGKPKAAAAAANAVTKPTAASNGAGGKPQLQAQQPLYHHSEDAPVYQQPGQMSAAPLGSSPGSPLAPLNPSSAGMASRLFRPLPKRRRMYLHGEEGYDYPHRNLVEKASAGRAISSALPARTKPGSAGSHSVSSSQETGGATLYDEASSNLHPSYSTPATSSSDGDGADNERTLVEENPVQVEDEQQRDDDGDEGYANDTDKQTTPLAHSRSFTARRQIDPGDLAEDDSRLLDPDEDDDDLLGRRTELLNLSTVEMLVKGVAEGRSLFGGAGVIAAVAGLGLYHKQDGSAQPDAPGGPFAGTGNVSGNKAMEEFAKLANWATGPIEFGQLPPVLSSAGLSGSSRSSTGREAPRQDDFPVPDGYGEDDEYVTREEAEGQENDEDEFGQGGRMDAFEANDKERWERSGTRASALAVAGTANTKKRKVPTSAAAGFDMTNAVVPSLREGLPVSPIESVDHAGGYPLARKSSRSRTSSQAHQEEMDDPMLDLNAMKGSHMLAQAVSSITAALVPPVMFRRIKSGRVPRSSHLLRRYIALTSKRDLRLPRHFASSAAREAYWELPTPYADLPPPPSEVLPVPIVSQAPVPPTPVPLSRKAAKKKAKAKLKPQKTSTPDAANPPAPIRLIPSIIPAPRLPNLYDPYINPDSASSEELTVALPPDHLAFHEPDFYATWDPNVRFDFTCTSQRYVTDLSAFNAKRKHLLAILKAKRKEEALRKKLEEEEERERLARAAVTDPAGAQAVQDHPPVGQAPAPPVQDSTLPPHATPSKPPPKKGKKKRSAYANANNVHHRQNYIPSRLPGRHTDSPELPTHAAPAAPAAAAPISAAKSSSAKYDTTHGSLDKPLPHGNASQVFNFEPDEWMCTFCEYELWYGSKPQLAKCVKKRKKLLKIRQKAIERAKGAADGTNRKNAAAKTAPPPPAAHAPAGAVSATHASSTQPAPAAQYDQPVSQASEQTYAQGHRSNARQVSDSANGDYGDAADAEADYADEGISHTQLLSYHCLAKGLPQPTYELFEWSPPGEGSDSDGTESYWYYAVLTLGSERFQLQYRDLRKLPECDNTDDAKEGLARRVLRYLLGSEDVDPEFALEEERLEITQLNARYEPKTNVEALEDYCLAYGRPLPVFSSDITPEDGLRILVSVGDLTFTIKKEVDERSGKEKLAVRVLKWLQNAQEEKVKAVFEENQRKVELLEERDRMDKEAARLADDDVD